MGVRKVADAVDTTTGDLIYFKGHAKATYMSDGSTVEDAIKNVSLPDDIQAIINTLYVSNVNDDFNEDFAI